MSKQVARNVHLKRIFFRLGRSEGLKPASLDDLIKKIFAKALTVEQRHFPQPAMIKPHDSCCFLNRIVSGTRPGVIFEVCGYQSGNDPEQILPDLSATELNVESSPILDRATGERKQSVVSFRCLVLGEAMLIENVQGRGGNIVFERMLHRCLKAHVDTRYPRPHFSDVATEKLPAMIKRGGGVDELVMDLAHAQPHKNYPFAHRMNSQRNIIKGTDFLRVTHKSKKGVLDEEDVISAFSEQNNDEGPDKVVIRLKDGTTIDDLSKLKHRRLITVSGTDGGAPNVSELVQGMYDYMDDLQKVVSDSRVLNVNGYFTE